MLRFFLNPIHVFVDATSVVAAISVRSEMKISNNMFSTSTVYSLPSPHYCTLSLQCFPQFFQEYFCNNTQHSWIFLDEFSVYLNESQGAGFSSLTLSIQNDSRLAIVNFENSSGRKIEKKFPLTPSDGAMDIGPFDYAAFVSMESKEFEDVVLGLNTFDLAFAIVSPSEVKFSNGTTDITLTTEARQCIIGGVAPNEELPMILSVKPTTTLRDMASQGKRVWFFKLLDSCNAVIVVPIGLDCRFLVSLQ